MLVFMLSRRQLYSPSYRDMWTAIDTEYVSPLTHVASIDSDLFKLLKCWVPARIKVFQVSGSKKPYP